MKDRFYYICKAAAQVINAYEKETKETLFTSSTAAHTKLNDIIKRVLKFGVSPDYDLPDGAMGRVDLDNKVITYAPGLSNLDRIFTVAHEIGHRVLNHPDGPFLDRRGEIDQTPDHLALGIQNGVYQSYSPKSRQELEANVFAAELLAPLRLVREYLQSPNWSVDGLASYFGLSKTAMLNQITAAMLWLPDEENGPARSGEAEVKDTSHERAILVESPAYVQAGPGAGKTRVLVGRYARLVHEGVTPRRILALTFSNKAAAEMRERIAKALPEIAADQIVVNTFHSFGLDLIRRYWKILGYSKEPTILPPADVLMLLRRHLPIMPLGRFESVSAPVTRLGLLLDAISRAKDELISPEEYVEIAERWEIEVAQRPAPTNAKEIAKAESETEHAAKCRDAAIFYKAYENLLRSHSSVDYGDLILLAVRLLMAAGARVEIQSEFDHILVDEFQDVNYASGRLVQALDGERGIVWAVGDARQSIYRFRGASPANLLRFEDRFPGATAVPLGRNYRSVKDIVACASLVDISDPFTGEALPHLEVEAFRGRLSEAASVILIEKESIESEIAHIVNFVKQKLISGCAAADIAVLCRVRADAQRISDGLEAAGISTSWGGDTLASPAFKDVLAIVALASGDSRGLERAGSMAEHPIDRADLVRLLTWRKENHAGLTTLLKAARDGEIASISEQTAESCGKLFRIAGAIAAHHTAYAGIANYLFEYSIWCRNLFTQDAPESRRALVSVQQLLTLARSQNGATFEPGQTPIQAFLEFLELAIESGKLETISPDLGNPQLVNVMTVHASKGLEWPVVIVPFLNQGKFPHTRTGERTPIPGGFPRDGDAVDDRAEEACLFFVAVTRARDYLMLTRAPHKSRKTRSKFLEPIVAELPKMGFLVHHEEPAVDEVKAREDETILEPDRIFDYTDLTTYGECPKKYEFERILGMGGSGRGYPRYHSAVARTTEHLRRILASGGSVDEETAFMQLDAIWAEGGPTGHFYERRLRDLAEKSVQDYVRRLTDQNAPEVNKEIIVDAGGRLVRVKVEEFEAGSPAVFRRIHLTNPSKSHLGKDKDDKHALYAMYADQSIGKEWRIEAYYPALGKSQESLVTSGMKGPLITNRKKKMMKLSVGILSGEFPPTGDERTCSRCAFNIVCPKGSSDEEDSGD